MIVKTNTKKEQQLVLDFICIENGMYVGTLPSTESAYVISDAQAIVVTNDASLVALHQSVTAEPIYDFADFVRHVLAKYIVVKAEKTISKIFSHGLH